MLELRPQQARRVQMVGTTPSLGDPTDPQYDSIVLDGREIGMCFRYENVIHWQVEKETIPNSIVQQAIWLLQSRNLEHAQQQLRITG